MASRSLGMVHGRFQPFHLGHLEYVVRAAARCRTLLVGVTSPERASRRPEPADARRHLDEANPFTYTERAWMVGAALRDAGIEATVVPFPISEPERWPDYVPLGTVHYLRVYDGWGKEKVARLRDAGFEVEVLDEGSEKGIAGATVRELLRSGGDWQALVPAATAAVIREVWGA